MIAADFARWAMRRETGHLMTFMSFPHGRRQLAVMTVLAAAVAAPVVASSAPAAASLSSGDWGEQTLPANFQIWQGASPIDPVSCVPGTEFCVVLASDLANTEPSSQTGYGALVTTDGGTSWNGSGKPSDLPRGR